MNDYAISPHYVLTGETVVVSFISDPIIGNGKFKFENNELETLQIFIKSVVLKINENEKLIEGFKIFDLAQEKMIDADSFSVAAKGSLNFLITFPQMPLTYRLNESITLYLIIAVNGIEGRAASIIQLEKRIPYISE